MSSRRTRRALSDLKDVPVRHAKRLRDPQRLDLENDLDPKTCTACNRIHATIGELCDACSNAWVPYVQDSVTRQGEKSQSTLQDLRPKPELRTLETENRVLKAELQRANAKLQKETQTRAQIEGIFNVHLHKLHALNLI